MSKSKENIKIQIKTKKNIYYSQKKTIFRFYTEIHATFDTVLFTIQQRLILGNFFFFKY